MSGTNPPLLSNSISQSSTSVAPMLVTVEDCHVKPYPSIKNFVEELEHTWGNSEKWVLEFRGGRQIAIPLSLYHSPGSMLDFSNLEGVVG